jgi:hypothetical protein
MSFSCFESIARFAFAASDTAQTSKMIQKMLSSVGHTCPPAASFCTPNANVSLPCLRTRQPCVMAWCNAILDTCLHASRVLVKGHPVCPTRVADHCAKQWPRITSPQLSSKFIITSHASPTCSHSCSRRRLVLRSPNSSPSSRWPTLASVRFQ